MKTKILCGLLVLICLSANAQRLKTVELKPIYKEGFRYYYDMKRVRTPYALQVPLLSLNDEEVERRYKNFNRFKNIGNYVPLIPFIYMTSVMNTPGTIYNRDTFLLIFLGTFGLDISLDILAHGQLKKGIGRYNELIVVPSSGTPGLALRYRIR
jgi:hypothetical protein